MHLLYFASLARSAYISRKMGRVEFLSENNDHILIKISRYNPSENLLDDYDFSTCRSNASPVFNFPATLLLYEVSLSQIYI
jgi:hypothetical protein